MFKIVFAALTIVAATTSCKKCHDCHYDLNGTEVELGEYCGDDLEEIESHGTEVNGVKYEVHCEEH